MAKTIQQAQEHAADLINSYSTQKENMETVDKMYFMDWEDKPKKRKYKFTTSPTARNALLGAIRLMTSTEPIISVPFNKNDKAAKAQSEKIEKFCNTIWYHSGRFRGVPLEQPAIESLLRYGMMVLAIFDTKDLKDTIITKGSSKAEKRQLERLCESTPYLIEAWDPKGVYAEWGRFGLTAVYRTVEMTIAKVIEQFGKDKVMDITGGDEGDLNRTVQYADYWDLEKHMAWISTVTTGGETVIAGTPVIDAKHNLPCIPIVIQTSEGSYMDSAKEYQALPFLFGLMKSELWERQNLELTYMYTNLFNIASTPTYKHTSPSGDADLDIDFETPAGVVHLGPGEDLAPLQKDVINKDLMIGFEISDKLIEESTIYTQALGGIGRLGANVAFSTVSLLHQAGRLSLVAPQKRGGWGIGTCFELIVEMLKDKYKSSKYKTKEGYKELRIEEIPDDLIIEAKLAVDLPQDQLSQANIAQLVTQSGLASRRWAREKILNIGQSDEMDQEIFTDMATQQMTQKFFAAMEQMMQMKQMGGMPPGQPPAPQGPPPAPQGPPGAPAAINAQQGLMPAQRPGMKPAPPSPEGMPMQEGEAGPQMPPGMGGL